MSTAKIADKNGLSKPILQILTTETCLILKLEIVINQFVFDIYFSNYEHQTCVLGFENLSRLVTNSLLFN